MTTVNYVNFPGLGIQDLPVDRVAFSIGNLPIYWYGILIAVAVLLSVFLGMRHAPKYGLTPDDVLDVIIAVIPFAVVFARLYYVVFTWDSFKDDLLKIVDVRGGGLAFYGGVIGGVLGVLLVARLKRIRLHRLVDFLVVYLPLGQAIGRWGNFFNQEAFGTNTTLPWGMKSAATQAYLQSIASSYPGIVPSDPVHPTFLYEFLANMLIFAALLAIRRRSKTPYVTTLSYLAMYGFVRFFTEGIRTDSLYATVAGLTFRTSQILSLVMFVVSVVLLWILRARAEKRAFQAEFSAGISAPAEGEGSGEAAPEAPEASAAPEAPVAPAAPEAPEAPAAPEEKDGPSGS